MLEAAGLEPSTISAHAGHINRTPPQADLELWRVLDGLAADAAGIAQDARFDAWVGRAPVAIQLDFPAATRRLDPSLREQFRQALDDGPRERLRVGEDLGQEALIREVHGHRFLSLPPEGVFDPAERPYADLESSAMEWRDFGQVAWMQSLVDEELGRLRGGSR